MPLCVSLLASIYLNLLTRRAISSPEQHYEQLVTGTSLDPKDVQAAFDNLQPVSPDLFIGAWKGANVNTNHPTEAKLTGMRWAGKTFRSTEDVDPIMVYDEDDKRTWNAEWGHARVSLPSSI